MFKITPKCNSIHLGSLSIFYVINIIFFRIINQVNHNNLKQATNLTIPALL
jgi:hypothetical protein